MLRKQIISASPAAPVPGQIDVAVVATGLVTSEDPGDPVDHAFNGDRAAQSPSDGRSGWL